MREEQAPEDSASVGVPASALSEGSIARPPEEDMFLSAEGPAAVKERARRVAVKTLRDLDEAVEGVSRQVRWLYFMVIAFVILLGVPVTQAVENSYHNCVAEQVFAVTYNGYLDTQVQNALKSTLLTPQQKAERVLQADHYHAYSPRHCTGVWPFQP